MKLRSVGLLVPLLLILPCAAQSQQAVQAAPEAEPTVNIDDVVVVNGWRHPVQLRLRMVELELAVYDLFNQLNDDPSLTLDCSRRNIGGTRLQITDCAPRYESEATQRDGQYALEVFREQLNAQAATEGFFAAGATSQSFDASVFNSYTPSTTGMPAFMAIKAGQSRMKHKMDEIAAEHPEFVEAVVKYVEAKERYTQSLTRDKE